MKKFVAWVSSKVKTFWNWLKSIYNEGKSILVSASTVIKDPSLKVSMTRVICIVLVGTGIYMIMKDIKLVFWAIVVIAIGCLTILVKSLIEKFGKK